MTARQNKEVIDEFKSVESLKDENGKTVKNSSSLEKRNILEKEGLWDVYKDNFNEEETSKFGVGKTVYNMSSEEFFEEYKKVFGGAKETSTTFAKNEKKESTKETIKKDTTKKSTKGRKKRTSSKSYKKEYEKIIKAFTNSTQTPEQTYKQIDKILDDFVFNDNIKKTVEDVRKRYLKEGLYDLIKKYLKDNPYADASAFGL